MRTLPFLLSGVMGLSLSACASDPAAGGGSGGQSTSSGTTSGTTSSGTTSSGTTSSGTTSSGTTSSGTTSGTTSSGSGLCGGSANPSFSGTGTSSDQWAKADVARDGVNYKIMANGWGPGFTSQTISWNGTAFTVVSMAGSQGPQWQPASYPTAFCGNYSDSFSKACGLPAAISSITTLKTGWIWKPNGNSGQYNVAYDIWVGTGPDVSTQTGFLMVWLRDPPGQQPAGSKVKTGITVANVPGTWNVWASTGAKPVISYVRAEGQDSLQLDFDVMDFWRDLPKQSLSLNATYIQSVAVGFEIWNGPITNLETTDFCVKVN